jgi:excisionase family DNA binding protein
MEVRFPIVLYAYVWLNGSAPTAELYAPHARVTRRERCPQPVVPVIGVALVSRHPPRHTALETRRSERSADDYSPLLTVPQVAQLMQCSVADVYDKVHRGEIPAVRWGKQFRFFRDEVIESLTSPMDDPKVDRA